MGGSSVYIICMTTISHSLLFKFMYILKLKTHLSNNNNVSN